MMNVTTLGNGLRVINEYMEDVESVSINVWIRTGCRNETKENNGISHFLEHMAFKGTKTRNTQQIAEDFDDIGGRVNAFTSVAKTAYYTKVLKENTERAVELLADIVQNSIYSEKEVEKERSVILQELAMTQDDPTDIISDYFSETAYKNQPYGRSILGPAKNIKSFTRNDILSYVNEQYKTEDMVISFAGKLKNDEAVQLVKKYFISLQSGKNRDPQKAVYTGGYFKKNKKLEQTQLVMGFESYSHLNEHFYEASVLSIVMGGGMSSRLFQEIRERKGLCYTISSDNESSHDTGIFDIYCAVSPERINETVISILDELKRATEKISEDECKRAIIKLKSNILMSEESNSSRARRNASNVLSKNRIISTDELIREIEAVNVDKLRNVMIDILTRTKPTLAVLGKINNSLLDYDIISSQIKAG